MKSDDQPFGVSRRTLVSSLALLPALAGNLFPSSARGQVTQADPLASWNEGSAKQAILNFVRVTTDQTSPKFVPPEDRIATFDQDGTLWIEHPLTNPRGRNYRPAANRPDHRRAISSPRP
jgi:hypothetical protein